MRKALLAFVMASGLVPGAVLAQNTTQGGITSGPAAGTDVQPGTTQNQGAAPNPSGAAGAGAPGTAARPGTEAGPSPSPGQQAPGMPGQGMAGQGMPGMPQPPSGMGPEHERPGMGREHAEMMRRMMHGMGPGWIGPGAFFRFRHGGNEIVIKCAANEPTQICVQAATVLMEMVMKQGTQETAPGGAPGGAPGQTR